MSFTDDKPTPTVMTERTKNALAVFKAIENERDRYREALEEIASAPDPVGRLVPSGFLTLRKIARDALPPEVES